MVKTKKGKKRDDLETCSAGTEKYQNEKAYNRRISILFCFFCWHGAFRITSHKQPVCVKLLGVTYHPVEELPIDGALLSDHCSHNDYLSYPR